MRATARRSAGAAAAAGVLPAAKKTTTTTKKKIKGAGGGFLWGCGGSKSVAIAAGNISTATTPSPTAASAKSAPAATKTTPLPVATDNEGDCAAPSVDALLRQLSELERGVRALGVRVREEEEGQGGGHGGDGGSPWPQRRRLHRRSASDWTAGAVAVVRETEDPVGEFRASMAQMVAANGTTGGAELRGLLQRFLELNSPRHHGLILQAFADVCDDLFSGAARRPLPRPPKPALLPYSYSSQLA
ncbi:transcription repressor OFP8 [Brachypodium distachyon]|uniref:Transcription repressor n=1 Tax=Brachypodium distachyon TaxID=15368 RepID=A0A2K2DVH1_BRADI|nr:transcription repressor OFP8 [Brachypodium distachyon]PNT78279.1 hypothetical protein BRADI_1g76781v3 [Brachypodium distachyon]|eukprot:XP_003562158.1 transcription repressor OFP8 [Brachypodium distachyon]